MKKIDQNGVMTTKFEIKSFGDYESKNRNNKKYKNCVSLGSYCTKNGKEKHYYIYYNVCPSLKSVMVAMKKRIIVQHEDIIGTITSESDTFYKISNHLGI